MKGAEQLSKYSGAAAGSTVCDYAVFSVLLFFSIGPLYAQMAARIAGGVVSFVINKYWSFGAQGIDGLKTEGRRFLVLYIFSYSLSVFILYLLAEQVGISPYSAKVLADLTCFIFNFLVMRIYVFSDNRGRR